MYTWNSYTQIVHACPGPGLEKPHYLREAIRAKYDSIHKRSRSARPSIKKVIIKVSIIYRAGDGEHSAGTLSKLNRLGEMDNRLNAWASANQSGRYYQYHHPRNYVLTRSLRYANTNLDNRIDTG